MKFSYLAPTALIALLSVPQVVIANTLTNVDTQKLASIATAKVAITVAVPTVNSTRLYGFTKLKGTQAIVDIQRELSSGISGGSRRS